MIRGLVLLALGLACVASGQQAVSIKPGLIHYVQGVAELEGKVVHTRDKHFQQVEKGQTLTTRYGRAEVVLAPGRMLRTGRFTEVELATDDLNDVGLRVKSGSAIIHWMPEARDGVVWLDQDGSRVELKSEGLYRIDARPGRPAELRVYKGKALVTQDGAEQPVRAKRLLALNASADEPSKFEVEADSLMRWNARRSRVVARQSRLRSNRKVGGRAGRGGRGGGGRGGRGRGGRGPK